MPDVMTALKLEIVRLARKEARAAVAPMHKPVIACKKTLAELKRRIAELETNIKRLEGQKTPVEKTTRAPVAGSGNWISGKGVRSLRQRLNVSQEAFAKLAGVTPNAVYNWERKPGLLRLRPRTKAAVLAIRKMGIRDVKAKLAERAPAKNKA